MSAFLFAYIPLVAGPVKDAHQHLAGGVGVSYREHTLSNGSLIARLITLHSGGDGSPKVEVLINIHKDRSRKKVGAVYEQSVFVVDVRLYAIML